jgi:hypothetical protein
VAEATKRCTLEKLDGIEQTSVVYSRANDGFDDDQNLMLSDRARVCLDQVRANAEGRGQ